MGYVFEATTFGGKTLDGFKLKMCKVNLKTYLPQCEDETDPTTFWNCIEEALRQKKNHHSRTKQSFRHQNVIIVTKLMTGFLKTWNHKYKKRLECVEGNHRRLVAVGAPQSDETCKTV